MKYLLAAVVAIMICWRTSYSPKNDGLSLPPITIAVGIDDSTDDSSLSSDPSAEVSSPALPIKNQSFINHLDAASSMSNKEKVDKNEENGEIEVDPGDSDMYCKALVVHQKMQTHLNHETKVKSGVEVISVSIAWEKHEVESRTDVFYRSQSVLDISDTSNKGQTIKDSRSISNTTTDISTSTTSTDKDRIFDKKQVDKHISISMPLPINTVIDVLDDIDMVRDSKQDENVTPEHKLSFPGLSLIATACLLIISIGICRRISRLATAKAKVANSIQRLYHGRAGRNRARSLAAAKTRVAVNIQCLIRGAVGRNRAKLRAAKIKVAISIQRVFRSRAIRMEPPGIIWSSLEQRQQGLTTARTEGMGDDSTISTHFTWNTLSYQSSEQTQLSWSTERSSRREDVSRNDNGLDIHVLKTAKALRADVVQTQELCTSELIHGQEKIINNQKRIMKMMVRGLQSVENGSSTDSVKIDSATEVSRHRPSINLHKILAEEAQQRHKQMFGGDRN